MTLYRDSGTAWESISPRASTLPASAATPGGDPTSCHQGAKMTTAPWQEMGVREIIDRFAYRQHKINANSVRGRYTMACPLHDDAQHRDYGGSFSVHANNQQWKCFGGCGGGGPKALYERLTGERYTPAPIREADPTRSSSSTGKGITRFQGATVKELADKTGLPEEFLRNVMLWRDGSWYRNKAVEMPYRDEANQEVRVRYRVGITGDNRFRARGPQILYGLWSLEYIRDQGYVIIVEGETDFAMLTYHRFPVIGVPGANNWKPQWAEYLKGVEVVVFREPGQGGDAFVETLAKSFPEMLVITAPPEAKDPCDLGKLLGDAFPGRFQELIDSALEAPRPPEEEEDAGFFTDEEREWYVRNLSNLKGEMEADCGLLPGEYDEARHQERETALMQESCHESHLAARRREAQEKDPERGKELSRVGNLYRHKNLAKDKMHGDPHFYPTTNEGDSKEKDTRVKVGSDDICIMMENPNLFVEQEELLFLCEMCWPELSVPGTDYSEPPPIWKGLEHCKVPCKYTCDNGHVSFRGINSCKLRFDPNCHTQGIRDLARLELPDLTGEESYVVVWLTSAIRYPDDLVEWGPVLEDWQKRWVSITKRMGDRKATDLSP